VKAKRTRVKKDRRGNRKPWGSAKQLQKWGSEGGQKTLRKKGPGYYAKIAKMRKHFGGGRPKKNVHGATPQS